MQKRLHCLEHAACEGLGEIGRWAEGAGWTITHTRFWDGESVPSPDAFDFLVVMGGAMGVHDHRDHPWLAPEKELIRRAIEANRAVLGICLGAQLISEVLGGRVRQNMEREIGWYPVKIIRRYGVFRDWPETLPVLHWHGDTFTIPPGAIRVAESPACANQAFSFGDRVAGLQFHLEIGPDELVTMTDDSGCGDPWQPGTWVQPLEQIRREPAGRPDRIGALHSLLTELSSPLS
jgi:GMP synthase-like glutamine amidotransferase